MNKKAILIIFGFILTIILSVAITLLIVKKNNNITSNKTTKSVESKSSIKETEEINKVVEVEEPISNEENKQIENTKENNTIKDRSNNTASITPKDETSINKETPFNNSEADVVNYIEDISVNSVGDKLKDGFIKVVDFLFYDGKIYSKTFKELSNSAKLKIISLAIKIDSKIDEYYPNYKEEVSSTTNKVYTNIKSKLISLYLDTTVKICNSNPNLCEDAKQGLDELKKNFGITWDFIKDISGIGLTKLKDWYEVWKEE